MLLKIVLKSKTHSWTELQNQPKPAKTSQNPRLCFIRNLPQDFIRTLALTDGKIASRLVRSRIPHFTLKSIQFVNSLHNDCVFINWQLMSALASLERFGEENLVFINWRLCRHCLQNEWPLTFSRNIVEKLSIIVETKNLKKS